MALATVRADPQPASAAPPESSAEAALPVVVQSAFDYTPALLAAHLAGAAIIVLLYGGLAPAPLLWSWLALFAVAWVARVVLLLQFRRHPPTAHATWRRWRWAWNVGSLSASALWGLSVWLFYGSGGSIQQTGLIVVVYSFCVGAVPVLAPQPRIYLAYSALCFVPMVVRIALVGDVYSLELAGILIVIFVVTTGLASNFRDALRRIIDFKVHADDLLVQLRAEKQAAEAARQEAEIANRAKTQFLAAASHDLRQPLHAMGLYAEALRQRTHDADVADLVHSINESVDALEGLFTELLDITRIDAGGVDVRPRPLAMRELFRRLELSFAPVAFEKGLTLRFRGGARWVQTDPVLLERALRNLVANAIRYTDDGSVLVSARPDGAAVRVQVWDTGPGIAPEVQPRIFEAFYQVPGRAAPTVHERKGLGLGLAIVARLAALLGTEVTLRSQPGRGSVFGLRLPAATRAEATAAALAESPAASVSLAGRHLVVVEDDAAVRDGLATLLASWGASARCFDSVGAASEWAAAAASEGDPTVDLLIVDYRLEAGRSGVEAIDALRRRVGDAVPAIVVTGSTMSLHEAEAEAHRFHLLFKPVLPHKLRAMIAYKLGSAARDAAQRG